MLEPDRPTPPADIFAPSSVREILSPLTPEIGLNANRNHVTIKRRELGELYVSLGDNEVVQLIPVDSEFGDRPGKYMRKGEELVIDPVDDSLDIHTPHTYTLLRVKEKFGYDVSYYRMVKLPGQEDAYGVEALVEYWDDEKKYAYKSADNIVRRIITENEFQQTVAQWLNIEAAKKTILTHPIEETLARSDYEYVSDSNNFFSARGINLEDVEPRIIENIKTKLASVDALVLIHPDYLSTKTKQMYKRLLASTIQYCVERKMPVFVYHYPDATGEEGFEEGYFNGTHKLPFSDDDNETAIQMEIDYFTQQLGKKPEDIRLGFGGMLTDLCVRQWRDSWCKDVKPEYGFPRDTASNPIAYGEIFPEITVDGLF